MNSLITKETLKQKILEGFIIGVMVSLTVALCGIVWNAFDNATERLATAEDLLNGQSEKLLRQSDFNGELLQKLEMQQGATEDQLEQLATDVQQTRAGLEQKLTELAAAINKLPGAEASTSASSLAKDFGKLNTQTRFDPRKQQLPNFKGVGRNYRDIVKQEPADR